MTNSSNVTVIDPFYVFMPNVTKNVASTFASLAFVLGVPGNILVVLVHTKIKDKSVTDWMIFYIAVCDIGSLLNMPIYVIQVLGYWAHVFPDILCKLHFFNSNSVSMAAYLLCACTSIERYFKVVKSKEIFSLQFARWMWVPVVLVSYGFGSLAFWAVRNNENGNCSFDTNAPHFSSVAYGLVIAVAFSTSFTMAICYIRTGVYLLRKTKDISNSITNNSFIRSYKNMIQTTKMLAIVTVVFLFSANTPYLAGFSVTFVSPSSKLGMSVVFILSTTFVVNNFFNPFLYIGMSTSFRRRSCDVVRSCCRGKYDVSEESVRTKSETT